MKKIIIDCDAGYDDAVALILLISAHKQRKLEIKGITCVSGNTTVDNVIKNVFRTLEACNALDIPVYKGAHSALICTESYQKSRRICYYGGDGFGDVFTNDIDVSKLQKNHAVMAIQQLIMQNPNEISMVCLGPLTNIALVIKMCPEVLDMVQDFYIMGGNLSARGNTTAQAEFNFYADVESVHIVLASNVKPLWLLPWETCLKCEISLDWRDNVLGKIFSKQVEFINKIEPGVFSKKEKREFYRVCDAFLAALVINSNVIKKQTKYHADIELNGTKTRGQVVLDHLQINKSNIHLIEEIDSAKIQELMLSAFKQ